jgi:hypothetical protein
VPLSGPGLRPPARTRRRALRVASLLGVLVLALGPLAVPGAAAEGLTMDARVLLQGHARAGSWAAIEVDLTNDGPSIQGELRMDGGDQSNARYSMAVNLPTGSRQTYVLHAQPPAFGRNVKVELVAGGQVIDDVSVAYLIHEATQLVVGVLAERPAGIVGQINLPSNQFGTAPVIVPLTVADLPERSEGWGVLDRLVWQDVDSNQLTSGQLDALRRWLAGGGRLVIVGGSAGIGTLSAFPDDILPYRPTATLDLDPTLLIPVIGALPDAAADLPAMGGALARGRALATSGDRAVAADLAYGNGRVTILGFDPTTSWLAESMTVDSLWRGFLPDRSGASPVFIDDSQLVQAVYQLPALALPPTSGLLVLIAAYILVIGPINYLILRRLDRRELAWVTMPILVIGFSAAAFGYGSLLRGTDVVINEISIVQGATGATEASAEVYFGIFSPTRTTYQVELAQGALLAAPINGNPFGTTSGTLDILQGTGPEQPSAVRDLSVGTGSLRVVRAHVPVTAPLMHAQLELKDGVLTGTFENASDELLEGVAVALGSSVAVLGDVAPHTTKSVRVALQFNQFFNSLADQVVGPAFDNSTEEGVRRSARYQMVSQLTSDPFGQFGGTLPADRAVILAFGRRELLDVKIGSDTPKRTGNVLYYVPVDLRISGKVTFAGDLLPSTVIDADAQFFSKDRTFLNMGAGQATIAYRPIPFEGTFTPSEVRINLGNGGGIGLGGGGKALEPLAEIPVVCLDAANTTPEGCIERRNDLLPEIEVFDRRGEGTWVRLPRLTAETNYTLADPSRYIDPATGQLLVRFVNESVEMSVGFAFQVAIIGAIQ